MRLLIGSDPEFFITSPSGEVVPAHSVKIPHPTRKKKVEGKGKFFRDGWALELNPIPSESPQELYDNICGILGGVKETLPKGYSFSTTPSTHIDLSVVRSSRCPKDVKHFGCNPSYNAYSPGVPVTPGVDAAHHPLRTLSGHLHFSGLPYLGIPDYQIGLVKWLDLMVGLPIAHILPIPESFERRTLYGRAGEFRPQEYPDGAKGVEYRVLDAKVLDYPALFISACRAAEEVIWCHHDWKWDRGVEGDLQGAINSDIPSLRESILRQFGYSPFFTPWLEGLERKAA